MLHRRHIATMMSRLNQMSVVAGVRPRRLLTIAGAAALLIVGGFLLQWQIGSSASANMQPPPAEKVPVEVAYVGRADVPIYLEGLGTVAAFNTVTVKTRVDGQIQNVSFVEGQHVKIDDPLVQIDPRPYQAIFDEAIAKKAQDQAQLVNAKLTDARYTALVRANALALQLADAQHALVAQLSATVRGDQGAVDAAKVQLNYANVTSPIDGITGIRLVDRGNIVHATDTTGIVMVTQLQPISVVFTLPEDDLPLVSQALARGAAPVSALTRDGTTELDRGTVLLIDNQIDQSTGTIRVKATFPNAHNTLWPGQFINARLLVQTQRNVLTVPIGAVQRGPNGFYAYVVNPNSTVSMRSIATGQGNGLVAVVTSGLRDGERVVIAGQYRLQPGAAVQLPDAGRKFAAAARATRGATR